MAHLYTTHEAKQRHHMSFSPHHKRSRGIHLSQGEAGHRLSAGREVSRDSACMHLQVLQVLQELQELQELA